MGLNKTEWTKKGPNKSEKDQIRHNRTEHERMDRKRLNKTKEDQIRQNRTEHERMDRTRLNKTEEDQMNGPNKTE